MTASSAATTPSAPATWLYEEAGVGQAYLVSYTPPIGIIGDDGVPRGCTFGVDMPQDPPPGDEFIARGRTAEAIGAAMGMPVIYLSRQGMLDAFVRAGLPERDLCTYCIGGRMPFEAAGSLVQIGDRPQLDLVAGVSDRETIWTADADEGLFPRPYFLSKVGLKRCA